MRQMMATYIGEGTVKANWLAGQGGGSRLGGVVRLTWHWGLVAASGRR